jgi:hypothetical protein
VGIVATATPGKVLAALLVAALFVCHGVFGYEHQLTPAAEPMQAPETSSAHHAQHHGPTPDQGAHHEHPSDGGYFATLLVLLLGVLLSCAIAPAGFGHPTAKLLRRSSRPPLFYPPRRPTAPTLQVFRL